MNKKSLTKKILIIIIFTILFLTLSGITNLSNIKASIQTFEDENGIKWEYSIEENNKVKITRIIVNNEENELIVPSSIDGYEVKEVSNQNYGELNNITRLIISEGIESIENLSLEKLSDVSLPNTLKIIGGASFVRCKDLENINIPNNVEEIGESAFAETRISRIEIPEKVKKIGNRAFSNCENLEKVSIPITVTNIEGNPFYGCTNLTIECEKQSEAYKWANEGNYGFTLDVRDSIAPTCIITSNIDTNITNANTITYTFEFSEKIKDFGKEKIFVNNGDIKEIRCISEDPGEYVIEVSPKTDGELVVGLTEGSCEDEAGNGIEATFKTITIDRRAPTCQIETEEGVTNKDSVIYKIKFSEEVQGITADIINVENGTKGILGKKEENGETYYTLLVTNTQSGRQVVTIGQGQYKDIAGNYNQEEAIKIIMIDKDAPIIQSITLSTTEITDSDLILKVNATDSSGIEGYSWDEQKTWLNYNQVIVKSNGIYKVYVKDRVGNISSKTIEITNIDKTLPKGEVTYSTAEYTNQDVTVTINVDKQVQAINGWTLSEDKKVLTKKYTQNTEETVTITDLAGNRSIVTVKIANIDKEAPVIGEITLSTKEITNQDVEITVNATDAISGIEGYSWDEKQTWNTVNKVNAKTNGIYTIYVKDKAGNISSKTIKITNINKEPEKLAISATKYKVDGNYIINIKPETKVSEVKNDVKSNREYEIQKTDGTKLTENDIVATGYKVKFATGEAYEIVVNGDVSGDGKITIIDVAKIKKHIINTETLTGAYLKAGDINGNDTITITDLAKIKKVVIGLENL